MSELVITSAKAGALSSAGTSDNPVIAWDNAAADATLTTTQGTEVDAAANAVTGATYDYYTVTADGSGNAQLQAVWGSAQTISFAALAAHNLGTLGASVRLQVSNNSGSTWTPIGSVVSPADDEPIAWYIEDTSSDYFRFQITGAGASESVAIGVVFLGGHVQIPTRIYQGYTPPLTATEVNLQSNVSAGGQLLGSAVTRRGSRTSAALTLLSPSFVRGAAWQGAQAHINDGGGFFWVWRPTTYDDVKYAWRDGAPVVPNNSGPRAYMSATLEMRCHEP